MTPTTFTRIVGLALLAFGGFLLYLATGMPQRITGGTIMAVSLALIVPAQLQAGLAILIGAGRSAGLIKTKPMHRHGTQPRLGETVSAPLSDLPKPPKRENRP